MYKGVDRNSLDILLTVGPISKSLVKFKSLLNQPFYNVVSATVGEEWTKIKTKTASYAKVVTK